MDARERFPAISDIGAALEAWADPEWAESYDNVGLQVGNPRRRVQRGLIALDCTPAVVEEAARMGAELIITHHPLLFHPLRNITPDTFSSNLALCLAEARIALYSVHTNLDAAPGGVSIALAQRLGLEEVRFLTTREEGEAAGLGAIGRCAAPMPLRDLLRIVAERLAAPSLRYAGDPDAIIRSVAVCGGSGSGFTHDALQAGADAYVTADVTYHKFFDVLGVGGSPRMALIDAGHYETEVHAEELVRQWLATRFPNVSWQRAANSTNPVRTFAR